MNSHYVSTSRSNPQFYRFLQTFKRDDSNQKIPDLNSEWKDRNQQAAWLDFWEREGHELLEHKWHKHYPNYKEQIEIATVEEQAEWQQLWEQHACNQSEQFWHIFTCVFENYERDLLGGLGVNQPIDGIDNNFSNLTIDQSVESCPSAESSVEDESYLTANDDPEFLDEEQQLRLLGLPTSFGVQTKKTRDNRKFKQEPPSVYESDSENSTFNMANDQEILHSVQSRTISKKKKKAKTKTKIPDFIRDDKLLLKYWFKRFSLFSLFDRGIQLDRESWFSVTPEKIAKQSARRLACDVIVDAFCGCGGNAIQFAKTCGRVIAIDIDADKLAMARQNAAIYGVAHKIEFIHADFLQFARSTRLRPDVVFLSPPWGGPDYLKQASFDIEKNLLPVGATELMQHARGLTEKIGYFLPRNSNVKQVIALTRAGQQCEVEHNYLDTRLVAITAYFGAGLAGSEQ